MTQLIPPRVVLPLSDCSTSVRLQGLVPGATVMVWANGHSVANGPAAQSDQTFTLTRNLAAGETMRAKQDFATEGSDFTPDGVKVLRAPSDSSELGVPEMVGHLYSCANCLWLDGAFPGAAVEVRVGTADSQQVTSVDGSAYVALNSPIAPGEIVQVRQTSCGIVGPTGHSPVPDSPPSDGNRRLLPPLVVGPLHECQQQIALDKVVDGATVTIHRSGPGGEQVEFACIAASSSRVNLVRPLDKGEQISLSQSLIRCELTSVLSQPPVTVGPADLPPPFLHGPICNRDRTVRVSGLEPGAHVMFMTAVGDFAYGTAWDAVCDFYVPDLFGIAGLSIKQGLCSPVRWTIHRTR